MIQKGFVARTRMCEATVRSHRPEPDRRPMADAHADAARDTCIVQWLYVLGEPGNGHGAVVQGPRLADQTTVSAPYDGMQVWGGCKLVSRSYHFRSSRTRSLEHTLGSTGSESRM